MNHVREFLCRPRKKRKGSCEASGKGCFTFILRSRFMPCFSLRLRFRDPSEGCSFFLYSPFFILFLYLSIGLFIQRIFFSIAFRLCSVVCFISFSFVLFLTGSGILSRMESFGPISPDFYHSSTMGIILPYMAKACFLQLSRQTCGALQSFQFSLYGKGKSQCLGQYHLYLIAWLHASSRIRRQ